jgi:C4-dicarboxylate-specific signal transduction histidine kinase
VNSKPKANDVISPINISLMIRRFRELREEEIHKTGLIAAKASRERSLKDVADAGIAAGRAQAFGDAAAVLEIIEEEVLGKRGAA